VARVRGEVLALVYDGAADERRARLCRAAVILERAEQRINACDVVRSRARKGHARGVPDEVVVQRVERAREIGVGGGLTGSVVSGAACACADGGGVTAERRGVDVNRAAADEDGAAR